MVVEQVLQMALICYILSIADNEGVSVGGFKQQFLIENLAFAKFSWVFFTKTPNFYAEKRKSPPMTHPKTTAA